MKLIKAISSGALRSLRSYKAVLLIWLITFTGMSLLAIPLRGLLLSLNGSSMYSDLLKQGFDLAYWVELDQGLGPILSLAGKGGLMLILLFQLVNVFLYGGLFDSLKTNKAAYRAGDLFGAGGRLFFSYLVANFIMVLLILFSAALIIGLPLMIIRAGESASDATIFRVLGYMRIILIIVVLIFLCVLDYARAWMAANDHRRVFKALGYGFRATFSSFLASVIFMALVVTIQVLFLWGGIKLMGAINPQTGGGLFLLFLTGQAVFIVKLLLRAWRYGGITALYEH